MKTSCSYFAVVVTVILLASCGKTEDSPGGTANGPKSDAGDAGDASNARDAVDAGQDASLLACTLGERGPCASDAFWGCPGATRPCGNDGKWSYCECKTCVLTLDTGSCCWTMGPVFQAFSLGVSSSDNTVIRIDPEAGQSSVPMVIDVTACTPEGGYYAIAENPIAVPVIAAYVAGEYATNSLTFTLCPASCVDHQQHPEVNFTLHRGGTCPIE